MRPRSSEVLWNLYFIQAVLPGEDHRGLPAATSRTLLNRDPKGELRRLTTGTLDEFGNRGAPEPPRPHQQHSGRQDHRNERPYAAWKDDAVGSDEEKRTWITDLVDQNPVPVDLTAKAPASYELRTAARRKGRSAGGGESVCPLPPISLSVIHMGYDDMESFYETLGMILEVWLPFWA